MREKNQFYADNKAGQTIAGPRNQIEQLEKELAVANQQIGELRAELLMLYRRVHGLDMAEPSY